MLLQLLLRALRAPCAAGSRSSADWLSISSFCVPSNNLRFTAACCTYCNTSPFRGPDFFTGLPSIESRSLHHGVCALCFPLHASHPAVRSAGGLIRAICAFAFLMESGERPNGDSPRSILPGTQPVPLGLRMFGSLYESSFSRASESRSCVCLRNAASWHGEGQCGGENE